MKSYRQFCGLARALDTIGERWTLLIVRELLSGPRTYSQIQADLPGVATNLLADRLRVLIERGVVDRGGDGSYRLTPWGAELREAIYALGRWAGPLMAQGRNGDHFRASWLHHMAIARFDGHDPERIDLVVDLTAGGERFRLVSRNGRVELRSGGPGPDDGEPDVALVGPVEPVVAVLLGRIDPGQATAGGVEIVGPVERLAGLRPRGELRPDDGAGAGA